MSLLLVEGDKKLSSFQFDKVCSKILNMTKIIGNLDGRGGRNDTYKIDSRAKVPRKQAVKEVEQGKHPGTHTVKINNQKYVRDNPDNTKKDNVNRNK
jgi:hypothetical protein